MAAKPKTVPGIEPMYASIGREVPTGRDWTFEPKFDGVRVVANVAPRSVRLITRNGNDKAKQFPEIVNALAELGERIGRPCVLDGEIVALADGAPARFQALQGRVHLSGASDIAEESTDVPSALMVFDLLQDGATKLVDRPWTERRAALEALFEEAGLSRRGDAVGARVRLSPSTRGRGAEMLRRARKDGWEGVMAKRVTAPYQPGVRTDAWLKLKIEFEQEFVVGGYTEPRNSREYIGALLLGYFDEAGKLVYVGNVGGGFTRDGLAAMNRRLAPLVRKTSPFVKPPHTKEAATWVRPTVVVEVKFSEWTDDGRLRQPIFLGVRDDKDARDVTQEAVSVQRVRS